VHVSRRPGHHRQGAGAPPEIDTTDDAAQVSPRTRGDHAVCLDQGAGPVNANGRDLLGGCAIVVTSIARTGLGGAAADVRDVARRMRAGCGRIQCADESP